MRRRFMCLKNCIQIGSHEPNGRRRISPHEMEEAVRQTDAHRSDTDTGKEQVHGFMAVGVAHRIGKEGAKF